MTYKCVCCIHATQLHKQTTEQTAETHYHLPRSIVTLWGTLEQFTGSRVLRWSARGNQRKQTRGSGPCDAIRRLWSRAITCSSSENFANSAVVTELETQSAADCYDCKRVEMQG